MKRLFSLTAIFALITALAFAQGMGVGQGPGKGMGPGQGMGLGQGMGPGQGMGLGNGPAKGQISTLTPAEMLARRIERLTKVLDLTPAQVTAVTDIFTKEQADVAALRTTLDTLRDQLQAAVKSNDLNLIESAAAAIGVAHGKVVAIEAKARAAFLQVLTPDQVAKIEAMRGGFGKP